MHKGLSSLGLPRRGGLPWAARLRTATSLGLLSLTIALTGCGGQHPPTDDDGINAYPAHYKADIMAAMHAYLNDPTGIHDAAVSEPTIKTIGNIGGVDRYVACLKFDPKKNATQYSGSREVAAVFLAGRFDQFLDNTRDLCKGVAYAPFPELQKLPP